MPHVPLDSLVEGPNIRRIPPSKVATAGLLSSIRERGILQSLVARPAGAGHLEVILGQRRFAAAKTLGFVEVPVEIVEMSDAEVRSAQLVENIQRETMHPVDQWAAVKEIMLDGVTLDAAAAQLGMGSRQIRQMEQLGRLNKLFLKYCEIQMPEEFQLRAIAAAPIKLQNSVAKMPGLISQRGDLETVNWHMIHAGCRVTRVLRSSAIFDLKDLPWEEDLFAQPDADDQFYTTNVEKFLTLQSKALIAKVKLLTDSRKRAALALVDRHGRVQLPKGFSQNHGGNPDKLKRNETAFYTLQPSGRITVIVGVDSKAEKEAAKKKSAGGSRGRATDEPVADEADPDADTDPQAADHDDSEPEEEAGRGPVTKEGQRLIAIAKQNAFREVLNEPKRMSCLKIMQLLVLALNCDNVTVRGEAYKTETFQDLATLLLEPGGNLNPTLSEDDIAQVGQAALNRIVKFVGPQATQGSGSGFPGETIGHLVGAERHLARFDTEEMLRTISAEPLRQAAKAADITTPVKSVKALRDMLEGKLPNWRPAGAAFGAVAPRR